MKNIFYYAKHNDINKIVYFNLNKPCIPVKNKCIKYFKKYIHFKYEITVITY